MKRLIFIFGCFLLLAACGTKSDPDKSDKQASEVKTMSAEASTTKEAKVDAPTKRDIDMNDNYPWQWAFPQKLKEFIDNGKIVYLWSDAPALEEQNMHAITSEPIKSDARNAKDPKEQKQEELQSMSEYTKVFVYEMKKENIGHTEYLDQLSRVSDLMASGNLNEAKSTLDQAKQIRTGQ